MTVFTCILHLSTASAAVLFAVICLYGVYRYFYVPHPYFPPGPRPDPFIGNMRQIPHAYQHEVFSEWGKTYGDVIYIHALGKELVILNSLEASRDLLEKRSAIYSDRPRFVLLTELMGWDSVVTHMPYSDRFRKHRRLIQQNFNSNAIVAFHSLQEREARILVDGLVKMPDLFMQHIRRFAASLMMNIAYGHTVKSVGDLYVSLAEEATSATVNAGSPGSTVVDFLPALKHMATWMPGAGFKRNAIDVRKKVSRMLDLPFEMVKRTMESGTAQPSFTSNLLEAFRGADQGEVKPEDEEDIKGVAGVLYGAGTDTTVCVLSTFFLTMLLHPEVYIKAQTEMDNVVGRDRLPNLLDKDSLPYLDCVLREVYRWNCPVPLGIPHRVMEDDIYRSWRIPRGAMVISNIWAMTQTCVHPEVFDPERFINDPNNLDPRNIIFGFGRRICPGKDFSEASVWIAVAHIVATLDISRAVDSHGNEIIPDPSFQSGFVSHPKPFTCSLQARSKSALNLIDQELIV